MYILTYINCVALMNIKKNKVS